MRTTVKVEPAGRLLSLIEASETPGGALVKVTVCNATSLLVKTIVLFLPSTTVMVEGLKFSDWLDPVPLGILTADLREGPIP